MNPVCPKCGFRGKAHTLGTHVQKCGLTAAQAFFTKVNKDGPGGCWIFTGSIKPRNGYGHIRVAGRDHNAHRWSWAHAYGPIPAGKEIAHKCDVPACVNPEHLFVASHHENMLDAMVKRRHAHGERSRHAKLTEAQVIEIRRDFRRRGVKLTNIDELAPRYPGVRRQTVINAAVRRTWRHIK